MLRRAMTAALMLGLAPAPAWAQPSAVSPFPGGMAGVLAFQSDARSASNPNGRARLYTIDLSSGTIAPLGAGGEWDDEQPRYSPDGRRVAFRSNRSGSYNLYVMDANGQNVVRVTAHRGNDFDPAWHPDGESLIFSSDRDRGENRYDLYRLWLSDRSVERLTVFFEGHAFMPSVSPDGAWVAFVSTTFWYNSGWANQVHVMELATRQTWPFDLTAPGCWPSWSPDGQSIAHVLLATDPSIVQLVSSFGDRPEPVAGAAGRWHYYPDWSPDSRLLAASISPAHHEGEDWDLAIIDPSRTFPTRRLTTGAGNDRLPDWRPHPNHVGSRVQGFKGSGVH